MRIISRIDQKDAQHLIDVQNRWYKYISTIDIYPYIQTIQNHVEWLTDKYNLPKTAGHIIKKNGEVIEADGCYINCRSAYLSENI